MTRLHTACRILIPLLLSSTPAWSAETIKYVALVDGGKVAGQQVVTHRDDGVTSVDFIFKDNGRGPELKETYTLANDGTYRTYEVKGTSTFGAPVDERFSVADGKATWTSTSDRGSQSSVPGSLYSPLGGTPQSFSVAIAALSKRVGQAVPLIPGGEMRIRPIADAQITSGTQTRTVQLMMVTGVGFTPGFAWATIGPSPRLFAWIFPGYLQLVEAGWEKNADALEKRQKQAENDALATMQRKLAIPLPGSTLIRNARVFDSERAVLGAASDVLVREGRIVSVMPASKTAARAERSIDADGRVLLPGLFDMHAHAQRWDGALQLGAGVTTVRDMGNDNATLQQVMADEQAGRLLMPRIAAAGFLEGESPMSARNGFVVKDLPEAKKAVDWYAANSYPQIKIYNSFPKAILRDTVAYAHAKGMRVSGHIPVFLRAQDAVDAGYDEIQHINQVLLNFFVDDKTDTRTLERFYLPAKRTAGLDFDSKPVQDFIATLAKKQIVIDPTLTTFDFIRQRPGQLSKAYAAVADHLPPDIQRGLKVAEFDIPDDASAALYDRSYEKMVEFVGRLYRAGVPLVAGTDAMPGFTLQRELELYVQAGLTPSQALQVATRNGAKYARTTDRSVIAPGKRADLILVDGEPTQDIADLRRVALVIKGDVAYAPDALYRAIGVKPFTTSVTVGRTDAGVAAR